METDRKHRQQVASAAISEYFAGMYALLNAHIETDKLLIAHRHCQEKAVRDIGRQSDNFWQ